MSPLPVDPYAFQARIMAALTADIADVSGGGFPRLNALREISIQSTRDAGEDRNSPATDQ